PAAPPGEETLVLIWRGDGRDQPPDTLGALLARGGNAGLQTPTPSWQRIELPYTRSRIHRLAVNVAILGENQAGDAPIGSSTSGGPL
ncbi:MAG: hypothetical protein ACFCBW_06875, partial [Candidatus Competibacterales bacterium]